MQSILEKLFGLEPGFLSREGTLRPHFNPPWPGGHPALWNLALALIAIALVIYVYRRDGRSRSGRILLGTIRTLLLAFVIALLNRPVLTLTTSHTQPSVVAVMVDDTAS